MFFLFFLFVGGLECVGHSIVYVAHVVYVRDVWFRTQRAAARKQERYQLSHPSPYSATHLPVLST